MKAEAQCSRQCSWSTSCSDLLTVDAVPAVLRTLSELITEREYEQLSTWRVAQNRAPGRIVQVASNDARAASLGHLSALPSRCLSRMTTNHAVSLVSVENWTLCPSGILQYYA